MFGNGWQLPRMGMLSFETIAPTRKPGINTVAIANEDGSATDSQLHLYIGKKQSTGSAVDKAGLTNGDLYVLNAGSIATDNIFRTTIAKKTPVDVSFKKIDWNTDVTSFAKGARENGMTFARIEDGEWDPKTQTSITSLPPNLIKILLQPLRIRLSLESHEMVARYGDSPLKTHKIRYWVPS